MPINICFIINPSAGSGEFQKLVHKAASYLEQSGCRVEQVKTEKKGDGITLAKGAAEAGFEVAVAVGGDGTINEVCNGLAGTETALGVLPAGTANVYAADMDIPIWWPLNPGAVQEAAKVIRTGQRRRIDLGKLCLPNGASRYFLMWCGIGLDAAITEAVRPDDTRRLGYLAWILSGLLVAYDFIGIRTKIVLDSGTVKKRILMAVASNGQLYGRVWRMAPEAKMDDGLLDIAIMGGHGWPSTIKHVFGLTLRRHVQDPDFYLYRTKRLCLSTHERLPVHVDGEPVGTTPVEIEVVPRALTVIVPQSAPAQLFNEH
jgi:YegS/Rv2252/BmrU family lipid kinase